MFKIIKDKIDEEFNPVLLNQLMLKSIPKLEEIKGKDLVLFIGALGAGKSTTINMLLGQNFKMVLSKYKNNKGKVVLRPALIINNQNGNLKLAKMGHIDQSETLYPEAFKNVDKSDIYYCDWPGFRDTRGTEARLAIFLAKLLTIQYARSIRGAVIVIDYETERNKVLRLQKHHIKDAECLEEFMKKDYAESSIFIVNCRLQPTEFDVNTFRKNFSSTYGVKKKNVLFMTPEIIKSKMELAAFRKRMLRKLGRLKVVKKENIKIKEYDVERSYLKELLILKASGGNKIFTELFAIKKLLVHTSKDLKNLQVDNKNAKIKMDILNKQIKEYKEKKLKLETKLHQKRKTIKNTTDKLLLEQKKKDALVQELMQNKGSQEKNYVSELKSIKDQKKKLQKKLTSYKDKLKEKEYENKKAQLLDDQKSIRNEIGILKYKKSDISQKISFSEKKKQQLDDKLTELNKEISQLKTSSKLVEIKEAKKTLVFSTIYREWNRRGVIKGLFTQFKAFRNMNNAEISFRGKYDLIDIEIMYKDKYGKEHQANMYPINITDLVQDTTKIKNEFWKQEWHIEKHKEIYGDVIVYKYVLDNSGTSGGHVNLRVTSTRKKRITAVLRVYLKQKNTIDTKGKISALEDKKKVVQYDALIENRDINKWCKNIENISNSLKQKQEALNNIGKNIDLINGKIEKLKKKIALNEREQEILKDKKKSLKEKNSDVHKTVDEIIHQNPQMQKKEQVVNRLVMQMINYNKDKSQLDTELHTTEKNLKITTESVVKLNDNILKIRDKISKLSNLVMTTKKMQISLHENIVNNRETFYLIKEWCGNKTIKHSILSNVASTEIIKNFLVNLANYLKAYNTALFKGIIEKLKSYPCMLIDQKSEPEIVQNYQEVKKFDPNSHTESDSEEEEGNNSDFKKDEQNKTQEIIVKKYKVEKNDLNTNIQSNDEVPPTPDDSDLKLSLKQEKQQLKKTMPKKGTFKKTNQQKPRLSFLDELTKTVLQQRRKIMKGKEGNTNNKDHSYSKSLNI